MSKKGKFSWYCFFFGHYWNVKYRAEVRTTKKYKQCSNCGKIKDE